MGLRQIRKGIITAKKHPVAMALSPTGLQVNGCQVLIGHPNPEKSKETAKGFADYLAKNARRAAQPNMSDMYRAHFGMCQRIQHEERILPGENND
jgi:hypothetical protein